MKELLIYALEVLACSAALLLAYSALLERRTAFRHCRPYLIGSMILSALIPALSIPVWKSEIIYLAADAAATGAASDTAAISPAAAPTGLLLEITLILYGLGVLFSFGLMAWQIVRIHRLRQGAQLIRRNGYDIVLTSANIASFSFFHTIYLQKDTSETDIPAIVTHELSHIRHRHSAERIVMECVKGLLWWNPFVWIAARKLTEVEEYEADRDVLTQGYDPSEYITTIFKTLFGYSPGIANGLRDSLTKKRFQMMTKPSGDNHALLRLAGTLPVLVLLLVSFAFTTRADEIKTVSVAEAGTAPKRYFCDGKEITQQQMAEIGYESIKLVEVLNSGVILVTTKDQTPEQRAAAEKVKSTFKTADSNKKKGYSTVEGEPDIYLVAEKMPVFPEGRGTLNDFRDWANAQIRRSEIGNNPLMKGKVILSFIVERDGSVAGIRTLQSPCAEMTAAAEQIVAASPKWKPGTIDGQPVRVRYTVPLDFNNAKQTVEDSDTTVKGDSENGIVVKVRNSNFEASEALVFIDGKEITVSDMKKVDTKTIESISVYKDSSAIAKYGERGKHGVILIKTKP